MTFLLIKIKALERFLWYATSILGIFVFAILFSRFFLVAPGRIDGPSMEHTFLDEDLFFVNKFVYLIKPPKRFDLVQILDPESTKLIVKRIIGMPGEEIEIKRGGVYIKCNGKEEFDLLDESSYLDMGTYTRIKAQHDVQNYEVGEFEYFLLGDNRERSTDSRVYSSVHRSRIVGRVFSF